MANQHPFQSLVDNIFGSGSSKSLAIPLGQSNNIIDALGSENFQDFQANFEARLKRLNVCYQGHVSRSALLDQINNISGSTTCNGSFAELSAIDFFNMKSNSFFTPPLLNVDIDVSRSLASSCGIKQANLDLCFGTEDLEIFTDVKILQDVSSALFNNIYKEVWSNNKENTPLITAEYSYDSDYVPIKNNRTQIRNLIESSINAKPALIDCTSIVPGLKFRLDWTNKFNYSQTSYCPYRHAEESHRLPFVHAKKFVKSDPFFLTFVIFPWFNDIINNGQNSRITFYRSLSRRVFCQYQNKRKSFKKFDSKFNTNQTFSTISKYLSGILFLEDNTISSLKPDEVNVNGYFFCNTNAKHKVLNGLFENYLNTLNIIHYDNFIHDNY
jgi:hypothetical protein